MYVRTDRFLLSPDYEFRQTIDTPEVVAERIRTLLMYVRTDRFLLSPDYEFRQTARWIAVEKTPIIFGGARIV